jgi:hypothetical protein
VNRDASGDVLSVVDGHLDVDIEEAEPKERPEEDEAWRRGGMVQIRDRPPA